MSPLRTAISLVVFHPLEAGYSVMDSLALKKAVVSQVDLGFAQIEGLMLPDGSFAVAVPQLAKILSYNQNTFSRDLKRLLGEGFRPSKIKTELGNQLINVISLTSASRTIYLLSLAGNAVAKELMLALVEEGLDRRFRKAFNQQADEDEYNARIALRVARIKARRLWTDVLRDRSLILFGEKPTPDQYKIWTVIVNERLFNKPHFYCDRDNMNQLEQEAIELFERMAERKSKLHPEATPDEIVEMALSSFE